MNQINQYAHSLVVSTTPPMVEDRGRVFGISPILSRLNHLCHKSAVGL